MKVFEKTYFCEKIKLPYIESLKEYKKEYEYRKKKILEIFFDEDEI